MMKTGIYIFLLFILYPLSSFGEIKKVYENDRGNVYIDFEKIIRKNDHLFYSIIINYKAPLHSEKSETNLMQTDCENSKLLLLESTVFDEQMGKGNVLYFHKHGYNNTFESIASSPLPNSSSEKILLSVCQQEIN